MSTLHYHYGWKYNIEQKDHVDKKTTLSFVLSLVTALVIVLIVAQVLAVIDHRIQYNSLQGYTFNQAFTPKSAQAAHDLGLNGKIVLQVEKNGEAWYINPKNGQRYFLGRPADAFRVMREQGLGVSESDFASWSGYAPAKLKGTIILRAQSKGEAYYVHPDTLKMYFLGRPADAFSVMREQGLGISNANLNKIEISPGYEDNGVSYEKSDEVKTEEKVIVQEPELIPIFQYCEKNNYFIAITNTERDEKCKEIENINFKNINASQEQINEYLKSVGREDEIITVEDEEEQVIVDEETDVTTPTPQTNGSLGPDIRVGLFYSEEPQVISNTHSFEVVTSSGNVLLTVPANTSLTIDYLEETNEYGFGYGSITKKTNQYIRFETDSNSSVFEIESYERRPEWNPSLNDNVFLGDLELRYNTSKDRTWIINELPLENYLKGIAETSNISPDEYQKTMMIAARTYATYHLDRATKHADEHFIVDAHYDQVYKGYGTQQRLPSVVSAVNATQGQVVTYDGEIAITPYFSWSDGRTRSMEEVWNASKPWLVSVDEPEGYTKTTLFGHGVGLSAHGALLLASDTYNYTAEEILKYYYTGIDLTPNYNGLFN